MYLLSMLTASFLHPNIITAVLSLKNCVCRNMILFIQHKSISKSSGGNNRWPEQCSRNCFCGSSMALHLAHPKQFDKHTFSSTKKLNLLSHRRSTILVNGHVFSIKHLLSVTV